MTTVTLCFYEIVAYPPRKSDKTVRLDRLDGSEKDLLVFLHGFFSKMPKKLKAKADPDKKGAFAIKSIQPLSDKRSFSGIIRSGEQGVGSELVNHADGTTAFERRRDHIEAIPLYFLVDLPEGSKNALLAFQTFGIRSMSAKVNEKLIAALKSEYGSNYTIKLRAIQIGEMYTKKMKQDGVVQEIIATRYIKSGDIASDGKKDVKCTMHFSPIKQGGFKAGLQKLLVGDTLTEARKNVSEVLAIDIPSGISELRAAVSINGRRRLINLRNQESFATRFEITEDLSYNSKDGHPVLASIDKVARDILQKQIRHLVS